MKSMKILLPVDGSPAAMAALQHALTLREGGLRASVVLVNVQPPATLYEVVTAHDPDVIREVRGAAGADLVAPAEALLQAAGVDYELEVAGGEPAALIVELAENYGCGLIVLGGEGDVVDDVVARSSVPVTVVPLPEDGGR
ncbi:MAG: universal stress protein [Candidatus Desulfobacillus denitrificans]